MHKKLLASVIGAVCMLGAIQAHATPGGLPQREVVDVSVYIPPDDFYVDLVGGGWPSDEQKLDYRPETDTFVPWNRRLDIKNTVKDSKVMVHLNGPATVTSGSDSIALNVTIGGVVVKEGASNAIKIQESTVDNAPNTEAPVQITVVKPTTLVPGTYTGEVAFVFDHTPSSP